METVVMNISGGKEHVGEPWLWRLGREFSIKVNVLKANIDEDFGWVQVALEGPLEEVQRATAWLHTTGLHVDPLQRSVGA
jgi:ABC-type methionine transport system ATPase subunit